MQKIFNQKQLYITTCFRYVILLGAAVNHCTLHYSQALHCSQPLHGSQTLHCGQALHYTAVKLCTALRSSTSLQSNTAQLQVLTDCTVVSAVRTIIQHLVKLFNNIALFNCRLYEFTKLCTSFGRRNSALIEHRCCNAANLVI